MTHAVVRPAALSLLAAVMAALAGPAAPQSGETAPGAEAEQDAPPKTAFMTGQELNAAFSGAEYEGCYVDGTMWAERTAADGSLYDTMRSDAPLVGSWWVEGGRICYAYTGRADTHCWRVIEDDGEFYFYIAETLQFLATTDCGDPIA